MQCGYNRNKSTNGLELIGVSVSAFILMIAISITHSVISENVFSTNLNPCWIIWVAFLIVGYVLRTKPSLGSLLPMGAKRKTLYAFLFTLLTSILVVLFFILCMLFIMPFAAISVVALTGEWILVFEESETPQLIQFSLQGCFFDIFLGVITTSCSAIASFTEKRKLRLILTFGIPLAILIFSLIMVNAANGMSGFVGSANMSVDFEKLPLSWLWLTVIAIISAATAVYAVIKVYNYNKPKNY